MGQNEPTRSANHSRGSKPPHGLGDLLHKLLFSTHQGLTRSDFMRQACERLMEFSACDALEVRIAEGGHLHRYLSWTGEGGMVHRQFRSPSGPESQVEPPGGSPIPESILEAVLYGDITIAAPFLTRSGSFWTGDTASPILLRKKGIDSHGARTVVIGGEFQSLAVIPFPVDSRTKGVLQLACRRRDFFTKSDVQFYEAAAETLGVVLAHQRAQLALRERIKELTCLYGVADTIQKADGSAEDLLRDVVELLPPAWQYPEIAHARITFDGRSFATAGFQDCPWKQGADIVVSGVRRGNIEVVYSSEKPPLDEGPFLREERNLINAVAETLGITLAHQRTQWALRERIKELTCLYWVAKATQDPGRSPDDLLRDVVELLPAAWQYPECTCARITIDGRTFVTAGFQDSAWKQGADINVSGVRRGSIEVVYTAEKPTLDEGPFLKEERNLLDAVAETLGVALAHLRALRALRERVKELTCLYEVSTVIQDPDRSVDQLLQGVVELLPPGWQYPEITYARVALDGNIFLTAGFQEFPWKQGADIVINGVTRGRIEVAYSAAKPAADEGPFLKEERNLLNELARQLGLVLERREAEDAKARLQEQLRHADRLATIGQLAAGAAHELNEPLGSVLGFAQLAKNCPKLPPQAAQDIDKIVNAALHAREIIKKLMLFARQMPTRKASCNLNDLVREGLFFLESRCQREGISLIRQLQDGIPEIPADPSQLNQVLVNLVVNAIQAMPHGGILTISTHVEADHVQFAVEDTGIGMTGEVLKQIFLPFFTTKGVGQGTGLGLSVVHGIVTSHGGTIHVESRPGKGSRFVVILPIKEASPLKEPLNSKEII